MFPNRTWLDYEKKSRSGLKSITRSSVCKFHNKPDLMRLGIGKKCNASCNNYSPLTHCV